MRLILVLVFGLLAAVQAQANEKNNFPVSIPLSDFPNILRTQMNNMGFGGLPLTVTYCGENQRVYCRYDMSPGLNIVASGDSSDKNVDLVSVNFQSGTLEIRGSGAVVAAVIQLTSPNMTNDEIDAGMLKVMTSVFDERTRTFDSFESDEVVYRLGLSPIQGSIFTASAK